MSAEDDNNAELIAGHSYDGIREYDNPMPRWWVNIFIGSVIFSVLYYAHYQLGHGPSTVEEYSSEMEKFSRIEAERLSQLGEVNEETLQALAANATTRAAGGEVYSTFCVQCHGATGGGTIGPNLTDSSWINGDGSPMSIYEVVNNGVTAKGMPAWSRTLAPGDLRAVVAYVIGELKGKNVAGGKPPEGKEGDEKQE